MSYTVRDDNATFGNLASVEFPNGAGAPVVAALQAWEPAGLVGQTATTFPASSFNTVWLTPLSPSTTNAQAPLGAQFKIVQVQVYYHTAASGAATLTIENVPAGTADGSGANVLSATNFALNTAQTNTPFILPLNANVDNLLLAPGSRVNINSGATATTGLVDMSVTVFITRLS